MDYKLKISPSPHLREKITTKYIMYFVIIALLPTTVFGVYNFGVNALLVILVSVVSAFLSEFIYEKAMKTKETYMDGSAILTGLFIAINMPANIPLWIPALGSIFAIIIVKQLFGGLGQNFMNPALGARCFLLLSFTTEMTNFAVDGMSSATPLIAIKSGQGVNLMDMFMGNTSGTIGETSALAILIGAMLLLILGIIDLKIPGSYILTFVIFVTIYCLCVGRGFDTAFILGEICGGGLLLGAFFMATDYVTSPITPLGKIVFGIILGLLTGVFRLFGPSAEGVSYAIIISNLLVPLIEKATIPVAFGLGGKHE